MRTMSAVQAGPPAAEVLTAWVRDARARTLRVVADIAGDRWFGPRLAIVNPLLWEIGHVAWFQERWVLRVPLGRPPLLADADGLYSSADIPHDVRWELRLPDPDRTIAYLERVRDAVVEAIESGPLTERLVYFVQLAVFHEDMHDEAILYTRQTLGYPPPHGVFAAPPPDGGALGGDAEIPGGEFLLGARRSFGFVFDNEKWEHPVRVRPFRIARAPVTQAEFAAFVEEQGYRRREFWSPEGWRWRERSGAEHPVYWRREGGRWYRRDFDRWVPLEPHRPVIHVNAYEAEAYCAWAGRRLPTEAEWELAACGYEGKPRFPWGDATPDSGRANLDMNFGGCADVAAHAAGDSPFGCRQMIGNVWEWTASVFAPYPGFEPDPYKEYSQPWFHTHRVLRGGAWATRARLIRTTWRNFYMPDRRDVWAGFRTCAAGGS
jgi:iron(II)-dependent oxidoreductase